MAWISLVIAGVCEIVWATGLKYSHGFTRLWPSVITVIGMIVSFYFLAQAVKTLPLGTSYAIWTGIGAIGSVIIGIVVFNDPANFWRFFFLALIMITLLSDVQLNIKPKTECQPTFKTPPNETRGDVLLCTHKRR